MSELALIDRLEEIDQWVIRRAAIFSPYFRLVL